jgi:hypothetical protein
VHVGVYDYGVAVLTLALGRLECPRCHGVTTLTHEIPKTAENCETHSDGRRTSEDHITHLSRTVGLSHAQPHTQTAPTARGVKASSRDP